MADVTSILIDGVFLAQHHHPGKYPAANGMANSYTCPLGPTPGRAWVLLRQAELAALDLTASHSLSFRAGNYTATIAALYLVKSIRMGGGASGDLNAVHLCEFVDKRFHVDTWSDTGIKEFNVRAWAAGTAPPDDYLAASSGATWTTVCAALWNTMSGILGAFPGLPRAPDGIPENLKFIGVNAWHALHVVLHKCGMTTAYNPLADTFAIVDLTATQTLDPIVAAKIYSAEPNESDATEYPETIRVWAHIHYRAYGQEQDTEQDANWVDAPAQATDIATGVAGAVPGTILSVWDDLPLVLDEDNMLENVADITARASDVAATILAKIATSEPRAQELYSGITTAVLPGSQIKYVQWRNSGRPEGCVTEWGRQAGLIRSLNGGNAASDFEWWAGSGENWATTDIGRHTYPNYPRLPNVVQVYDDGEAIGAILRPNADALFPGRVRRYVAGALDTLEDCWIRMVDYAPLSGAPPADPNTGDIYVTNGDCFIGRLSGNRTSDGDLRPVYTTAKHRPDLDEDCIDLAEWDQQGEVPDLRALTLSKDGLLRLWQKKDGAGGVVPGVALIGLRPGDSYSLMWSNAGESWPQWAPHGNLGNWFGIGATATPGWIKLLRGAPETGYWLAAGPSGEQKLRFPTAAAPGRGSFFYCDDVAGDCHQAEWHRRGMCGYLHLYDCDSVCQILEIDDGLIVNGPGLTFKSTPSAITCPVTTSSVFDPCP